MYDCIEKSTSAEKMDRQFVVKNIKRLFQLKIF